MLPAQSCQNETDLNWLKNQVKIVGEREILASLVEFKLHSMAETIRRNEKGEKKTKAEAPSLTKKDKKHQTSNLNEKGEKKSKAEAPGLTKKDNFNFSVTTASAA